MGIDLIIERKPMNGKEAEFIKLRKQLDKALNQNDNDSDSIEKSFYNISISPYDTLKEIKTQENNIDVLFDFDGIYESELLEEDLKEELIKNKNDKETIILVNKLDSFMSSINKNNVDINEYNEIMDLIKWLKIWGNKGHGYIISY